MTGKLGRVIIGTSGWHYKHWREIFYPAKMPPAQYLGFYAQHFRSVEINNSFYRLPTPEAFTQWREHSPPGFVFAVKASRFITHMKKLLDPELAFHRFFERADLLQEKLGPILFQLPPRWAVNLGRLDAFFSALPPQHQYVLELREQSWCIPEVFHLCSHYRVALCIHDYGGSEWPGEITADFTYLRMHGPTGAYYGAYSDHALQGVASRIRKWQRELKQVYVYFNNDPEGHAITDAQRLSRMLDLPVRSARTAA
ncbi:MAG: DUF72 domain-containing protein [Acidobacteriales bacterium]|nr:DUF72 domain-containing protein [Terriglobales bacterium]